MIVLVVLMAAACRAAAPDGTTSAPGELVLMQGRGRQVAFIAEKATQRLHVYEWRDGARLLETVPCTTGRVAGDKRVEGDLKTPEGPYVFLRSIDGDQLPPLYGSGALTMDYPNPFDLLDGKTGSGIWMHGVESDERASIARDTRGCVALRNDDFTRLSRLARIEDTPIVVVERLVGVPIERVRAQAASMRARIEAWRSAWESRDMESYLAFYAPGFRADGRDLASWARQKRAVAESEGPRRVALDELVILRERDRWRVSFRQEYATAGHQDVGRKTLFLKGDDPATSRIVGERWRPVGGGLRLIDPGETRVPLSEELVAAIAPDAARAAAAPRPAPRTARPAPRRRPEPEPATGTPAPLVPSEPAAGEPAPAPTPAAAEVSPPPEVAVPTEPAPPPSSTVEPVVAPTPPSPEAVAPAPDAPVSSRRVRLLASLAPARSSRGTFRLLGPHARREGEALLVQVQLLNERPTSLRSGALEVRLPDAADGAAPAIAEPFSVKQGRLVALTLPDADLPLRIAVVVRDERGRIVLDQDLLVDASR